MKRPSHFFNWLICTLVSVFSFQFGQALPLIDNPITRSASLPRKPALTAARLQRFLVSPKNRPSADPIRFTITCNKSQVAIGEPIELTITAYLLDIPANLMFFLPGATGYSLKLLSPEGFQQTENELSELTSGELAYPARTTATYHVRGYFVSAADRTCFRLLRGSKQATTQSLFEAKATLCLTTESRSLPLSSSRARAGLGSQTSDPTPQLQVRSSLTSAGEVATNAASVCTSFAQVCSGNNQEVRTVTLNVATAGRYPLTISYRAPEGNVDGILRIDNVSQSLRFSQTSAYATITTPAVQLRAGDNTIGLSSGVNNGVGGGYLCFNSVCVGSGGGCTPPPAPTLSASTTQVCAATAATLTADGCSGTVTWSTGQTGSSISVNTAGNYSATCTITSCVSGPSNSLTLSSCPTPPTPPTPPTSSVCTSFAQVCSGNNQEVRTVTLNVATAGRYPLTISYRAPEGNVDGILRIDNVSQSLRFSQTSAYATITTPAVQLRAGDNTIGLSSGVNNGVGGGYLCFNSVCVGSGGGCTPPPAPTLSASTTQVCPNNSATLTASGCSGTVTWSTGQTGSSISVNTAGNYSATCTITSSCVSIPSNPLTLITCPALPVSGCTDFAPVCSGNNQEVRTVTLNVATAGRYPLTISYRSPERTVEGTVVINNVSQNLRFNQTSSYLPATIASVQLNQGNNTIGLSSGATGGYLCFNSICAGNGGGCTPPPAPTLSASTTQVCPNTPATLTASGCSGTVTWSTGVTGNSISANTVGSYSAICTTTNGCSSGSSTPIILNTCATPPTGSCSIDDYSAEINITYKP